MAHCCLGQEPAPFAAVAAVVAGLLGLGHRGPQCNCILFVRVVLWLGMHSSVAVGSCQRCGAAQSSTHGRIGL